MGASSQTNCQVLSDTERFPWLTPEALRFLNNLYEHPAAPLYNHRCGDRLDAEGLRRVREYERDLRGGRWRWPANGSVPAWVEEFAGFSRKDVPVYRNRNDDATRFLERPTISRAGLAAGAWRFVPDSQSLDNLIVYNTSGRTGNPVDILSHPEVAANYVPVMRMALERRGVQIEGGTGNVAIALVCDQQFTYTFATVCSVLDGAGLVKINLATDEWRTPGDHAAFLESIKPEVVSGDPISLLTLTELRPALRPKGIISTAMTLSPALEKRLTDQFQCPVLDLYSMNETGPLALRDGEEFEWLADDVWLELLRADGSPAADGEQGEVTVTTARNPFLPLLRYRTGDWAARAATTRLRDLEGRPPVLFRLPNGRSVNNIDITVALRGLPIPHFQLHQRADGRLIFRMTPCGASEREIRQTLAAVLGADAPLDCEAGVPTSKGGKWLQYTTELKEP